MSLPAALDVIKYFNVAVRGSVNAASVTSHEAQPAGHHEKLPQCFAVMSGLMFLDLFSSDSNTLILDAIKKSNALSRATMNAALRSLCLLS